MFKKEFQDLTAYSMVNEPDSCIPKTPSALSIPTFLMSPPLSFSSNQPNNIWMENMNEAKRKVDINNAFSQFSDLYAFLVKNDALVYLMNPPLDSDLQDLVFCANAGILLEHWDKQNTIVVSNFTSEPRIGETPIIKKTFDALGYETIVCPHKFEGEADLKFLYGNNYIGGYGIRTEKESYKWMKEKFDMNIVEVKMKDEYLYHLDCSIFPITYEDTMVCTELFSKEELKKIEKITNIVPVSYTSALLAITNNVRVGNYILNMRSAHSHQYNSYSPTAYAVAHKDKELASIASRFGLQVKHFCLDEYTKGGGALSCLVMHLNHRY